MTLIDQYFLVICQYFLVIFQYFAFQIKLVNINATDLVDGRPAIILGLIWTIILYFQVSTSPIITPNHYYLRLTFLEQKIFSGGHNQGIILSYKIENTDG